MIDKKFKNLIVIFVNLIELMSQVSDWRCLKAKKILTQFHALMYTMYDKNERSFFLAFCASAI